MATTMTKDQLTDDALTAMRVVDADSHVSEPPDLWLKYLPSKFQDVAPRTEVDRRGEMRWRIGDRWLTTDTAYAVAGWKEFPPSHPPEIAQCDQAAFYPDARIERLDEFGIHAQVLYPNLIGFFAETFREQLGDEAATACVRAYNDFLTDFCSVSPDRLIPITAIPYWDIEAALKEVTRCTERGHRGMLFGVNWPAIGMPPIGDERWTPLLSLAEELELPINIHIGFSQYSDDDFRKQLKVESSANFAKDALMTLLGNARNFADLVASGVMHRHPTIDFVAVESGCGWLPFLLEALDWQWKNLGATEEFPERELPSFYVRRQVYGMFWFEEHGLRNALELMPDNIMFETDFPHPTSLSPGPASGADRPQEHIRRSLAGVDEDTQRKVLHDTAARLYKLD